ncbi:MAG: hypothetical protein JO068_13460 [Hyphomicrobiales bacterium]|nr:hypothetical protein [Hyphomicrobiales bacterium]
MSIPVASEKKLLATEDFEAVKVTHHPAILSLSLEALQSAKRDLGERREKLRLILVENRRARVRRTAREAASKRDEAQAGRRKQVFAKALRRLNHELSRREEAEARARPVAQRPYSAELNAKKAKPTNARSPRQESAAEKPARASKAEAGEPKASTSKGGSKGRKSATPKPDV